MAGFKKPRVYAESKTQIAILEWLAYYRKYVRQVTFYIANEGKRSPREGALLKLQGLMPGASDLFIGWPTVHYHGLFLEIKPQTEKRAVIRPEQLDFLERMKEVGYAGAVVVGVDYGIFVLREYIDGKQLTKTIYGQPETKRRKKL